MYLFYLDESGNTGVHADTAEPVHWIVGLAVHDTRVRALEDEMAALAARVFGDRAREPGFEFHGADIFSGRRECRGIDLTTRVALYRAICVLAAEFRCTLFIRGIDKARHLRRAERRGYHAVHPHTLAFQWVVERMDEWLEKMQPAPRVPTDQIFGLLVADEQKEVAREVVRSFARWRDTGTAIGHHRRTIRLLVDTVHYVPSSDSWLLQLADCVTYLRNRSEKIARKKLGRGEELGAGDAEIVSLWETYCRPLRCCDGVWP